ncbi:hypothetical protein PG994_005223 [Apiospora phragmitis]|uniref:Non-haem dioxygenase N-terminal domain-containing protein n=1 Tax=Apiospora phragmitis TaxID=2905665 RepID=A0ABR1VSU2_9PEZI
MTPQDVVTQTSNPVKPELPKWQRPEKTKHGIPWANIQIIDLSTFDEPGGKAKLAAELRDAIHHTGFFSVVGTGISRAEVQRQLPIAQAFFRLPHEAKARPERPSAAPRSGTTVEQWDHAKFTELYEKEARRPFFEPFQDEIDDFSRKALDVALKLLELSPAFFADQHRYGSPSDDHLRYMSYRPRPLADDAQVENTWTRAHTDFGTLTLLWSQNVAGLQIKTNSSSSSCSSSNSAASCEGEGEGEWKSTTHHVVRPPPDQLGANQLGLFYFVRPGDDAEIAPAAASPLLRRLGLVKSSSRSEEAMKEKKMVQEEQQKKKKEKVTGRMYVRERVKDYHSHGDYADRKGQVFQVGNLRIVDEAR